MYRLIIILVTFLASATLTFGQKQENFWYFGNRGAFDFNSGSPVNLFTSQMNTLAGSACISDHNGNLLFYSDGAYIWNANNDTMPNGAGMLGNSLSTQSALIVPKPGNNKLYYVFTTDAIENLVVNGLRYSIVDMLLQGGLGDVSAVKNILLETPMTEKLAAVQDSASQNIWIVGHKWLTNEFYAYKIDSANGLNTTPVISAIGVVHSGGLDNQNAKGYMKISRDGTKLALAINELDRIELFDFNITTGIVSNYVPITNTYTEAYGVEFSPDVSRLYVTGLSPARLYQLDLLAGTPAAIIASSTLIATSTAQFLGALQTAPDGKIYTCRNLKTNMGVINNPNTLGASCNYVDVGPFMITGYCNFGLPNLIKLYIPPWITSVKENINPSDFSIYPNPSPDGIFTISCSNNNATSSIRIIVFDVLGHEVYSQREEKLSGNFTQKINLWGLAPGIYQVVFHQGDFKINRKILITP